METFSGINQQVDNLSGLSEILEVLQTIDSPDSDAANARCGNNASIAATTSQQNAQNYNLQQSPSQQQISTQTSRRSSTCSSSSGSGSSIKQKPYIRIIEQPKSHRFRYPCEGRSAGSIEGVNSKNNDNKKTFPAIEIVGCTEEVKVFVSCVTKEEPYRVHPHNLVDKNVNCKNGVFQKILKEQPMRLVLTNLGVQCVKKNDIRQALEGRQKMSVDPFRNGFDHKDQPNSIDLNWVRLCFQAFVVRTKKALTPVVSDPILNKKGTPSISRLCSCAANVKGGDEIIMLCEKVTRGDVKIRFFELSADGNDIIWEAFAEFQPTDIHKQFGIAFKTPRYHTTDIRNDTDKVFIQLLRPSDGESSEPLPFQFKPDQDNFKRKRKAADNSMSILERQLQIHNQMSKSPQINVDLSAAASNQLNANMIPVQIFKTESDLSPNNFGPHRSPYQMMPSPQPASPIPRRSIDSPSPIQLNYRNTTMQNQQIVQKLSNFSDIGNSASNSNLNPFAEHYVENINDTNYNNINYNINGNNFVNISNHNNNNNNNNNNIKFNNINNCDTQSLLTLNPFNNDHQTLASNTSGGSITAITTATCSSSTTMPSFQEAFATVHQMQSLNMPLGQQQLPHQQFQQQQQAQQQLSLTDYLDMSAVRGVADNGNFVQMLNFDDFMPSA